MISEICGLAQQLISSRVVWFPSRSVLRRQDRWQVHQHSLKKVGNRYPFSQKLVVKIHTRGLLHLGTSGKIADIPAIR